MHFIKRKATIKSLHYLILIFISTIFISCSSDENDINSPIIEKPLITLVSPDTNYINCESSQLVSVDLFAQSSLISGKSLAGFRVTSMFNNGASIIVLDTAISDSEFFLTDYLIEANPVNGIEIWTFMVTDVAFQYEEIELTLNISN